MSNKKQSSIIHIRSWVRTNGKMSEDGKSITYSCAELEAVIRQAEVMNNEEKFESFKEGFQSALESLQGANNLVQSKKL